MIWVLLGEKSGDNAQVLNLANALSRSFEIKKMVTKPAFDIAKPRVSSSLHHIDLEHSDALAPPWPDLVLTIGRRLSMVAFWIKQQSHGRTKIVLIGRPKGGDSAFDLIIAPVHYRVPEAANICRIGLPLLALSPEELTSAGQLWKPHLAHLPRPLTVLLIGGSTGRQPLDPRTACAILSHFTAPREANRGSLYIVTSRRTPPEAIEAMAQVLPPGAILYRWRQDDPDNPYLGLLALGSRFVVTGDSISMLVEVARLGKPLAIAPVPDRNILTRLLSGKSRDFSRLHDYLYRGGWAVRLGQPFVTPPGPPPDDTELAAARLRSLLPAQDQSGAEKDFLGEVGRGP